MKRNCLGIWMVLVIATLFSSCAKEEIMQVLETPESVMSETIVFGGGVIGDITLTRSSGEGSSGVKVIQKELKSESSKVSLPMTVEVQKGIHTFSSPDTRAAITTDKETIDELDAWCIYTEYADVFDPEGTNQIENRRLYFADMQVPENGAPFVKNDADGIFYPAEGYGPYLWISDPTSMFNFFTVSPVNSGFTARINLANNAINFDYKVPEQVADHKDILVASPAPVTTDFGQSVPLTFKHVLAAVNVKVGSVVAGTITSVKLKGVMDQGSYFPDATDGRNWTNVTGNREFQVQLPNEGFTVGPDENGRPITTEATSFMMIPQQLQTGAEIEVGFTDAQTGKVLTLRGSLQGDVWEMSTTTNYLINIDGNYNISIVPLDKLLDSHYIITKVEVSSEFSSWTLTASANDGALVTVQLEAEVNPMAKQGFWTDKLGKKDANGNYYVPGDAGSARGEASCSGGYGSRQIVYVFIPENVSGNTRTITLSINAANVIKELVLTQEPVIWLDPVGSGETYWGCELLIEGGQVPWGFCWDGVTEEYITTQGNQISVPNGQLKHVTERLEEAGFNLNQMYDPNFYINLVQRTNNNKGWLLQIDYSKIGNIEVGKYPENGYQNTLDLYNFDGISTLAALKEFIANQDNIQYTQTSGEANVTNTLDFAAMYAMKRNRFNLYDDSQGLYIPFIEEKDFNWYLPAKEQFPVFMGTNWGQQFSFNDLYWTSTAYLTDTETDNAHSYSYLNGFETISHRNDKYLTFALRRYSESNDVQIPINPEDVIKPGDDINGGGDTGGDVEGNT